MDINKDQRRASNPFSSVWVSASAGSGKTKVLTDRVLNLLLINGHPERLLCLTFTKTAAAEMANRINDVLKSWVVMGDEKLATEIENLLGEYPDTELLEKARRLFALALETPGGMKIMTIHSFCQSILKRFPLEAGIPPHFEVMDDTASAELILRLIHDTFKTPELKDEIALLSSYLEEPALLDLFKTVMSGGWDLIALRDRVPNLNSLFLEIKRYFNVQGYSTENEIILSACSVDEFEELKKKYLLSTGKGIKVKFAEDTQAQAIFEATQKIKEFKTALSTCALLKIAFSVLEKYLLEKNRQALLDYDDLINYTKRLLEESEKTAWVMYKLDGGIDHILVDEAQDTNPKQWTIIRLLAEEFFAGSGASEALRTLFAVGDKKQSIYSFQGADPHEFERMRMFFEDKVIASENDFATVPLNLSFRSTKPILDLVNFVLKNPEARNGVLFKNEEAIHLPFRDKDAGLVEIWPLEETAATDEPEGWKPPIERIPVQSSATRLAQKIARKIKKMLQEKEILPSAGRPIRAGDFLILVQRRGKFVTDLVRFLKEENVPVAGVDRLVLSDHIAVQDLMAMAKFALMPEDDLNLAAVLKSPLINITEDELFKLCYNRGLESVWMRLKIQMPDKAALLSDIMERADKMPPFEFFGFILGTMKGRTHFEARLGTEVNEALDEFLNLTLAFEKSHISSLQGFLKWMSEKEIEIKRDLDQSSINAVRIMTVHGSKGLQGNIVFLPDTRFIPNQKPSFVWTETGLPLWFANAGLKTDRTAPLFDTIESVRLQEYRRLLYVALTRPRDRVYICGADKKRAARAGNWYDLVVQSLPHAPDNEGIIRLNSEQIRPVDENKNKGADFKTPEIPAWALTLPPSEPMPPKPLMPSRPTQTEEATETPLSEAQEYALRRGTFIHQLLHYLPDVSPSKRQEMAQRLKPADIEVPNQVFELLENSEFAPLFGPSSLAEVPVVGVLEGQVVSGQIDRLVILPDTILIVDFKTNRRVPTSTQNVPEIYKSQLKAYAALLKNIFPSKMIKTYLLWVQNVSMMEIK